MEQVQFKVHVLYPKGLIDMEIITRAMSTDEIEALVKDMMDPTGDVVIEKAPVLVQQEEYFPDQVILKKALLEKDIIIEFGVHERMTF